MFKRLAVAALFTLGTLGAAPVMATPVVVLNGDFTGATYGNTGVLIAPTYQFGAHSDIGTFAWKNTGDGNLSYIAKNGTQIPFNALPDFHLFAQDTPFPYGGNIYAADAGTGFNTGTYLVQTLSNLTIGKNYTVSFLQASGSAYNAATGGGNDTARWLVGLGGETSYGPFKSDGGYTTALNGTAANPLSVQQSALMMNGADGTSAWTRQSLSFRAQQTDSLLSFFATGTGAPPFALLADVSISAVPEPATWAMMILGFGVVGGAMRAAKRRSDEKFEDRIKRITNGEIA